MYVQQERAETAGMCHDVCINVHRITLSPAVVNAGGSISRDMWLLSRRKRARDAGLIATPGWEIACS